MTRGRVALTLLSSALVAARSGLARQRARRIAASAGEPAVSESTAGFVPVTDPDAEHQEATKTAAPAVASPPVSPLASALRTLAILGVILSLALVVWNVTGSSLPGLGLPQASWPTWMTLVTVAVLVAYLLVRPRAPGAAAPRLAILLANGIPLLAMIGTVLALVLVGAQLRDAPLPIVGAVDPNLPLGAILLTLAIWCVYLLWKVPQWQAASWRGESGMGSRELFEIENASRSTLGQILSGVAVLAGLLFAWQQLGNTNESLEVSQQGQITDRFSRGVEQLGSDELSVRLGGIYALERIARDSERDYGPVMEVLTAFARERSPLTGPPALAAATPGAMPAPAPVGVPLDVQAVLKVIGRRTDAQVAREVESGEGCLDLSGMNLAGINLANANMTNTCFFGSNLDSASLTGTDLSGAQLSGADMANAKLSGANLTEANLTRAVLTGAALDGANLTRATLLGANLSGQAFLDAQTRLNGATLNDADLRGALIFGTDFAGADLAAADLTGAVLSGADLRGALHLTRQQVESASIDRLTKLPPLLEGTPAA